VSDNRVKSIVTPPQGKPRIHYAWIIVAVTFLNLLVAAGIRSAPGVLMIPLEEAFGWNRTVVSTALSINIFL
jgi:hypothetical protein